MQNNIQNFIQNTQDQYNQGFNYAHKRDDDNTSSLYVGDLSKSVYDIQLFKFFERNGFKPLRAKAILDKMTKEHRGFGYV